MRTLLPTLKEKKRYLLFRILSKNSISKSQCEEAIQETLLKVLGELNCARAGIMFFGENYKDNTGIIRVGTQYVNDVKLALATIKKISGEIVTIEVIKVSGMIGKLKKKGF